MKKRKGGVLRGIYMGIVLLFLYAPIAVLIFYSFNESKTMAKWGGFSLKWYKALFADPMIMRALWVTVSMALLSALFATIIGTFAAIGINSMKKRHRTWIMAVTNLPVVNPEIVTGLSLMLLFTLASTLIQRLNAALGLDMSFRLGYVTMLLSHITFNIPYVILAVMPRLKQTSNQLYEAALDLGAKPSYALFRIVIPEIRPGIVTGAILAFTLSIDDFVISFFTGQGVQNLSVMIYSMARTGIKPKINALSAIMFVVILTLLLIVNMRDTKEAKLLKKQAKEQRRRSAA